MTNRIAIYLGAAILAALTLDWLFNDAAATVFLLHRLRDLIEYMIFWR